MEDAAGALPEGEPLWYAVGVGGGDAADFVGGAVVVVPAEQVVAVGEGLEAGGFEVVDVEAVVAEFEVVDDLILEHVADVGAAGDAEVWEELFGDAGAADEVAPFEDEGLDAGLGEVVGGDEAVVAAADDDCGVTVGHGGAPVLGLGQAARRSHTGMTSLCTTWMRIA